MTNESLSKYNRIIKSLHKIKLSEIKKYLKTANYDCSTILSTKILQKFINHAKIPLQSTFNVPSTRNSTLNSLKRRGTP